MTSYHIVLKRPSFQLVKPPPPPPPPKKKKKKKKKRNCQIEITPRTSLNYVGNKKEKVTNKKAFSLK